MAREFVARWAIVDAIAQEIEEVTFDDREASPHQIAERLVQAGWRLVDDV